MEIPTSINNTYHHNHGRYPNYGNQLVFRIRPGHPTGRAAPSEVTLPAAVRCWLRIRRDADGVPAPHPLSSRGKDLKEVVKLIAALRIHTCPTKQPLPKAFSAVEQHLLEAEKIFGSTGNPALAEME
jgi:hypothetical protein